MEKLKIGYNRDVERRLIAYTEDYPEMCNEMIGEYELLELGKFKSEDFDSLFFNTEQFLKDKIMKGRSLDLGGFVLDTDKAWEMIVRPKGYYRIIELKKDLSKKIAYHQKNKQTNFTEKQFLRFLIFDESGTVIVNPELIEDAKEKATIYANSEQAIASYIFATKFIEIAKETNVFNLFEKGVVVWDQKRFSEFIGNIIDFKKQAHADSEISVKIDGIKLYDK